MYAYAPNGTPIAYSKDSLFASASVSDGSFARDAKGNVTCRNDGGSAMDWDSQKTVVQRGQTMWIDADGDEWPACALVLVENELGVVDDEDSDLYGETRSLPEDLVTAANAAYDAWAATDPKAPAMHTSRRFVVDMPEDGWRQPGSFTPEEKARLRPVAETLAMLDGNAFFGMDVDEKGDDIHYERYLPEAAAVAEANNGWFLLASFVRGDATLPENPMGLVMDDSDPARVDLAAGDLVTVRVSGIRWDVEDDEAASGDLSPLLPEDLVVGVPADWNEDDGRLADLLSDHYGFCILSIDSSEAVEA